MRKPGRTVFWLFPGFVTCATFSVLEVLAQNYPVKPIRMLVGFSTGSTDVGAHLVAPKMTEQLGQSVIVENLTGAGGSLVNEKVELVPKTSTGR